MKKVILFFVYLFFFGSSIKSQQILIGKKENIRTTSYDSIQHTIFVFFKDHYKKINTQTFHLDSLELTIEGDFKFQDYTTLSVNSVNYFIHRKGGLVFQLKNDTIKRIDKSFNHLMQNSSNIFSYNSKILRYGGYGFWSDRNFITSFDTDIFEWLVLSAENSKEFPEGTSSGFYQLINDEVYFFNGSSVNPKDRVLNYFTDAVWKYNFTAKSWEFIGKSSLLTPPLYSKYLDGRNYNLLFYENKIIKIDILKNKLKTFRREKYTYNWHYSLGLFYVNNRLLFFTNTGANTYLTSATEDEFLGNSVSEKSFYKNYNNLIVTILSLFTFIILGFLIRMVIKNIKKRKKIVLLENGLRYKNKFTEFDAKSMEIIKILISNHEISSGTILKILEEQQYSPAHNERIKVQKLEEINIRIKDLLGINFEILTSKKSDIDRRIRLYSIKNELFFK